MRGNNEENNITKECLRAEQMICQLLESFLTRRVIVLVNCDTTFRFHPSSTRFSLPNGFSAKGAKSEADFDHVVVER